jgi:hypothetical protein
LDQEAIIELADQVVEFVPVVMGLFFSLVFFFVAIRLLLRSDWETEKQSFVTGIVFIFLGCWAASGTAGLSSSLCEMTGLVILGALLWYARWLFRAWFEGFPLVGQKWKVLGVGEVEVVGTTPVASLQAGLVFHEELPITARVQFKDAGEVEREISVLHFRFKATLIEPKAPGRRY